MLNDFEYSSTGELIQFNGNVNLKPINCKLDFTKEHISEYLKCAESYTYFTEHYYYVTDVDKGLIIPTLRDYQKEMIQSYVDNRYTIVLASRQCVSYDTIITLKSKTEEFDISIVDAYELINTEYNNIEYEIYTNNKWKQFAGISKTEELDIIEITTNSNKKLKGSHNHIVFSVNDMEITLSQISIGMSIKTIDGIEKVTNVEYLNYKECLYDVIDVDGLKYFTNGILSHNCGKSTSFEIYVNWTILFQKDKNIAILANKAEQSCEILMRIKMAYEQIPRWMQQGVKIWNVKSIKFENGSRVFASSTNSSAIRGRAVSHLICDEVAFIRNWSDFISSVYPTISSGKETKVIYVSTPSGMNHFYKDWLAAIEHKSEFTPIKVGWERVPGRDEQWKNETISNIGQVRFSQEFNLDFLGSIATLIDPAHITELKHLTELPYPKIFNQIPEQHQKFLKIYEEPIRGHVYSIGVDSCKMTEENTGDALGMQVIDITSFPFKQVATFFAKEGFNYLFAPEIAVKLGNYYNEGYMFVENNEVGQEVANIISLDYEYENTFYEKGSTSGFRTTKKTKRLGCTNLKMLVESGKLILNDFDTISQLSTFIRVKDSYKAESGYQDDLIMALIASIFFMLSKSLDISDIEDTQKMISTIRNEVVLDEEDIPGFGVLPDDDYESEQKADAEGFTW